jgi:mevalonate pyrophosphate decarboxylase
MGSSGECFLTASACKSVFCTLVTTSQHTTYTRACEAEKEDEREAVARIECSTMHDTRPREIMQRTVEK